MPTFSDRQRLKDQFLGLAGRIERLQNPLSDILGADDHKAISRWQSLYAEEIVETLRRRETLLEPLTTATVDYVALSKWIDDANEVLKTVDRY